MQKNNNIKKQNKINRCVRLRPNTIIELEKIAEAKERKTTELMRIILENYVEQYKLIGN